ncbi:MAG: hypothetical protein JXQ90_10445 [Cyclobacteriaceae bacterium]
MNNRSGKPSKEAKALSLFLMAFKTKDPIYKEKSKWINKRWDLVKSGEMDRKAYAGDVRQMLDDYGGYVEVVEKTVQYYVDKTGEWSLQGEDEYCQDARKVADRILKK